MQSQRGSANRLSTPNCAPLSGALLVQSTLAGLGIEVELAPLAAIEVPVCIIATAVTIVFYIIKDRKMVQKYYK